MPAMVAAPVAAVAAPMPAFDVQQTLLAIVAERTGYPTEMLSLDADLEADLGIDSIKRVDILGAFQKEMPAAAATQRSEEPRVGKQLVRTCSSRWCPYHYKKKT